MFTKKKLIIFASIIVVIIGILVVKSNFYFTITKDSYDSTKMINNDIEIFQPVIDDILVQYNNNNFSYLYNELFAQEIKGKISEQYFIETCNKMYSIFGKYISYNINNATISIRKDLKSNKTYYIVAPAVFEKNQKTNIKITLSTDSKKQLKLYGFYLGFN